MFVGFVVAEPFPEYGIVIIVLGSLLVVVLCSVFFIYRSAIHSLFKFVCLHLRMTSRLLQALQVGGGVG